MLFIRFTISLYFLGFFLGFVIPSQTFIKCKSLKYYELKPPNMSMQLPTKFMQALLLGFGIVSAEVFIDLNFFVSISITRISFRSLLNLPPKIYIFFSKLAQACPHLAKKEELVN